MKCCAGVDYRLALSEELGQPCYEVVVGRVRVGKVGRDGCCVGPQRLVANSQLELVGSGSRPESVTKSLKSRSQLSQGILSASDDSIEAGLNN